MLGTTAVVLLVGSMMLWYQSGEPAPRRALIIGGAALLYVASVVALGWRSGPSRVAWWPFALAGLATGAVTELVNANFLVTRELLVASVTGLVIGTAHWAALGGWIRLTRRQA